jgi:hypothetical protein
VNLRTRLITADPFKDALAADRADRAVPVVNRWLRDKAAELRTMPDGIDSTARSVRLIKAEALENLADTEAAQ